MQIINENVNITQHFKRQTVITCTENMNYYNNGANYFTTIIPPSPTSQMLYYTQSYPPSYNTLNTKENCKLYLKKSTCFLTSFSKTESQLYSTCLLRNGNRSLQHNKADILSNPIRYTSHDATFSLVKIKRFVIGQRYENLQCDWL
jgi:hypothetical protein